jgi:NTP pyrophosphatase (non-canonical NTP hydrolase)
MKDLCRRVHESILEAGGYWPPDKIVIRLAEEMGEVCQAHRKGTKEEIVLELADTIITAIALANCLGMNLEKAFEEKLTVLRCLTRLQPMVNHNKWRKYYLVSSKWMVYRSSKRLTIVL